MILPGWEPDQATVEALHPGTAGASDAEYDSAGVGTNSPHIANIQTMGDELGAVMDRHGHHYSPLSADSAASRSPPPPVTARSPSAAEAPTQVPNGAGAAARELAASRQRQTSPPRGMEQATEPYGGRNGLATVEALHPGTAGASDAGYDSAKPATLGTKAESRSRCIMTESPPPGVSASSARKARRRAPVLCSVARGGEV